MRYSDVYPVYCFLFLHTSVYSVCPYQTQKKVKKEENDYTLKLETPKSESGTTRIIQPVRPSMTADPKGDPEYTRIIPKIRERKKRHSQKNDDVQDISKF